MSDLRQAGIRVGAAAVGFILLVLVWQWISLGSSKDARIIAPEPLPGVATYNTSGALADILEHNLWEPDRQSVEASGTGAEQAEAITAAPEVSVQFKALVQKGDSLLAVIGSDNDPASFKNYAKGDTLPNGKVLLNIDADKITYGDLPENSQSQPQENDESEPTSTTLYLFGRMGSASE